ncbi:MAG: SHOCT domain-containing protein [Candidatus Aminicenantes bacterium]|nr:SHOCT domain-containing protein [Candidatus Aminicenantes bacterium]
MKESGEFNLKGKRATVRPSPTASVATLIMSVLFLFFGLLLISSNLREAGEARGVMVFFLIVWIFGCLGMAVYSIINLASYGKSRPNPAALEVVEVEGESGKEKTMEEKAREETGREEKAGEEKAREDKGQGETKPGGYSVSGTSSAKEVSFAVKLRELESLRKEGLLTEEEYQRKRREIIEEKW